MNIFCEGQQRFIIDYGSYLNNLFCMYITFNFILHIAQINLDNTSTKLQPRMCFKPHPSSAGSRSVWNELEFRLWLDYEHWDTDESVMCIVIPSQHVIMIIGSISCINMLVKTCHTLTGFNIKKV